MNHNQSSRPFLRLFSALQAPDHSPESVDKLAEKTVKMDKADAKMCRDEDGNLPSSDTSTGPVLATTCDQHHDTKRQSNPLHSEDKMIAGSVGPQSASTRPATKRPVGTRSVAQSSAAPRRVEVSLAEIAPVLADAINHQRGWLSDFSDDTVSIDADLYEVLLAYQQLRRLDAA